MKTKTIVPVAITLTILGFAATGAQATPASSALSAPAATPAAQTVQYFSLDIGDGYYGYRPDYYSYGYRPYRRYHHYGYRPYRSYEYRSYGYRSPFYRYPDGIRQERSPR